MKQNEELLIGKPIENKDPNDHNGTVMASVLSPNKSVNRKRAFIGSSYTI